MFNHEIVFSHLDEETLYASESENSEAIEVADAKETYGSHGIWEILIIALMGMINPIKMYPFYQLQRQPVKTSRR